MSKEKKTLSAKKYLSQLKVIDEAINQDLGRLSEMKENTLCTGGIDYSRDRVQTSPVGDRLCSDVTRYTAFNEEINAEIDRFIDAKERIIKEIRELHDVNYIQVLYKVYVQFKTLTTASREMHRSYNFVLNVHKKALKEFEEIHKNLTYLY